MLQSARTWARESIRALALGIQILLANPGSNKSEVVAKRGGGHGGMYAGSFGQYSFGENSGQSWQIHLV
jgi:hypothetical protein